MQLAKARGGQPLLNLRISIQLSTHHEKEAEAEDVRCGVEHGQGNAIGDLIQNDDPPTRVERRFCLMQQRYVLLGSEAMNNRETSKSGAFWPFPVLYHFTGRLMMSSHSVYSHPNSRMAHGAFHTLTMRSILFSPFIVKK